MRTATVAAELPLMFAPFGAHAQEERPPLGCFAYVQFHDDLPADTIRADLGYGL